MTATSSFCKTLVSTRGHKTRQYIYVWPEIFVKFCLIKPSLWYFQILALPYGLEALEKSEPGLYSLPEEPNDRVPGRKLTEAFSNSRTCLNIPSDHQSLNTTPKHCHLLSLKQTRQSDNSYLSSIRRAHSRWSLRLILSFFKVSFKEDVNYYFIIININSND